MEALSKIEAFRNLNKELSTIVNKSEEIKKVKKEKQESLTKEEKKELTEEEKEMKSRRKKIQEQLLQFAKRVPVFMYLTDDREQTLLDVIQQLETDLFSSVTNLTLDDFNLLIEIGIFNESTMNDAVLAFKRFEDASLNYLDEDAEKDQIIGAWNTKVSREELFNMELDDDFENDLINQAKALLKQNPPNAELLREIGIKLEIPGINQTTPADEVIRVVKQYILKKES